MLSHFDAAGAAHMVDVSGKPETARIAVATGHVRMTPATLALVREGRAGKGDVIGTARLAGIMGAKRTADLIPLCHPLPITRVALNLVADDTLPGVRVTATVATAGRTGVEMEALTAVATACLTLYDMLKAAEKGMVIGEIRLLSKAGGASGDWQAGAPGDAVGAAAAGHGDGPGDAGGRVDAEPLGAVDRTDARRGPGTEAGPTDGAGRAGSGGGSSAGDIGGGGGGGGDIDGGGGGGARE